jgi:hypothetical protein
MLRVLVEATEGSCSVAVGEFQIAGIEEAAL